jgi:C4-type Zn-finger protein
MIDIKNIKTLGLREMHPLQVEGLLEFVRDALNLAALTKDDEIVREVQDTAHELLRLFGGQGVTVSYEDSY